MVPPLSLNRSWTLPTRRNRCLPKPAAYKAASSHHAQPNKPRMDAARNSSPGTCSGNADSTEVNSVQSLASSLIFEYIYRRLLDEFFIDVRTNHPRPT